MKKPGKAQVEADEHFKQLAHAQKMDAIGRLASGIAHDFNNLLTINLGYASILLSRSDLSPRARACVEAMNDATERAAGLTRQLLAFSRQQSSISTLISPNSLIQDMAPLLKTATGEGIRIDFRLDDRAATIKIDKTQLEQILMNLVINSRDAISDVGTIQVQTLLMKGSELPRSSSEEMGGEYSVISVKDTGHGMSDTVKERLFEPFFTTKDAGRGTGLGLSTVFGIVQKHNGHIWVESEEGKGTAIHVAFPIDTAQTVSETSDSATKHTDKTRYVMIVDDEADVRQVTLEMLKEAGFRVFEASGGADALKHLADRTKQIDLVLTDVVMPKISGLQLADKMRNAYPGLPIVFMSGHARDSQFQQDVEDGRKKFLQKPFTHDHLLKALQEAFSD